MSDFQLGLLIIGALAIGGVVVYNRIQERLAGTRAERAFGSRHADVLLEEASPRREPTLEPVVRKDEQPSALPSQALPDETLDYVIELTVQRPIPLAAFVEYWGALEHRFAKRALAAGRIETGGWKRVAQGESGAYREFRAALQLVSRAGIVSEAELIEFRSAVENLAAALGTAVAAPEMKRAMERARELDQFCAEADVQVALSLLATEDAPFPAAQLDSALMAAGLGRIGDAAYALRDVEGRIRYMVSSVTGPGEAQIAKLGFFLDLPRVPEVRRTFEAMVRLAGQLTAGLGGTLVDDNGRALDAKSLEAIGAELDSVARALEARGLAAGGPLALRLFS